MSVLTEAAPATATATATTGATATATTAATATAPVVGTGNLSSSEQEEITSRFMFLFFCLCSKVFPPKPFTEAQSQFLYEQVDRWLDAKNDEKIAEILGEKKKPASVPGAVKKRGRKSRLEVREREEGKYFHVRALTRFKRLLKRENDSIR